MGFKDLLARGLGAGSYGHALGREAVKNGGALGRALYLGHGTRTTPCDVFVFENGEHMRSEGFVLYCADETRLPPVEDSSELSKHSRAAGVAFAVQCAMTAAENFIKRDNVTAFIHSMGAAGKAELGGSSSGLTIDLVMRYLDLLESPTPGVAQVLDFEKPGTNDLLSVFLKEAANHYQARAVGFRRGGVLGLDAIAVPLAQETVRMIHEAVEKFCW